MSQATGKREHHSPSPECQAPGVAFVIGVSAIIDNRWAPTEYGNFYKKCASGIYHLDQMPVERIENEMLCALMCCCSKHPAHGNTNKNLYQMCVKDILDTANNVFQKKGIPATRFLAEPYLDNQRLEFSRGRMNPYALPRTKNARIDIPDVVILSRPSEGQLFIKNVQRNVEMKFSNEEKSVILTNQQAQKYLSYGKPVTIMYESFGPKEMTGPGSPFIYTWSCGCTDKDDEKQLEKDAQVLDPIAEYVRQREMFFKGASWLVPGGRVAKALKGVGGLVGKGLGGLGKLGKLGPIPNM